MPITKDHFDKIVELIFDEHSLRKGKRGTKEKQWKEIDRQIAMEPSNTHKLDAQGLEDKNKAWMPSVELPLQAQTLEVLDSDAKRMIFPDSGPWFQAHSLVTSEHLAFLENQNLVSGENDHPSIISQDNVDKIVHGQIEYWHRQYDFEANVDMINTEAFKYGDGVGRVRLVKKQVFKDKARSTIKSEKMIPMLIPRSIKKTFLDDSEHAMMNEGNSISPSVIYEMTMKIKDLMVAAKGNTNPENPNGGWMPAKLEGLEGNDKKEVTLLEFEGDLVVPNQEQGSMLFPNRIITVVMGGSKDRRIVRVRESKTHFNSYIVFPYHKEHLDQSYASSPLMKGWPLQVAGTETLNLFLMAAAYNGNPAMQHDPDDTYFASGFGLYPGAKIPSLGELLALKIGDPQELITAYGILVSQYHDVTGVNAPRLGAQTKSHTTAFSKEAELSRGTVRTVDYVKSLLKGPLTQYLYMAYEMGRKIVEDDDIFIPAYNGYVKVSKEILPEKVEFEAHGAGGPQEEQVKTQARLNSLQLAIQIDTQRAQMEAQGMKSNINFKAAMQQILTEGKWNDVDSILNSDSTLEGPAGQPGLGATPGVITEGPSDANLSLVQGN